MPTPEGGHDRDEYEVAEKIFSKKKKENNAGRAWFPWGLKFVHDIFLFYGNQP